VNSRTLSLEHPKVAVICPAGATRWTPWRPKAVCRPVAATRRVHQDQLRGDPGCADVPGWAGLHKEVVITFLFHPDPDTHIEPVHYGMGGYAMGLLATWSCPWAAGAGRPPSAAVAEGCWLSAPRCGCSASPSVAPVPAAGFPCAGQERLRRLPRAGPADRARTSSAPTGRVRRGQGPLPSPPPVSPAR
jgi:hypothetical protein